MFVYSIQWISHCAQWSAMSFPIFHHYKFVKHFFFFRLNLYAMSPLDFPGSGIRRPERCILYEVFDNFAKLSLRYQVTCSLLYRRLPLIHCIVST